jgi:NAD+ kinase
MELKTFFIYAKNPEKGERVKTDVEKQGFVYTRNEPDFIITVGGDGTFLEAERDSPGIPKLLVRDSLICFKCHDEPLDEMLEIIQSGNSRIEEIIKLEVIHKDEPLLAVNDMILRNENPTRAIRFKVSLDGEIVDENAIGDGVVVATPFGATGYYRSVTRSTFEEGIGIAFNNPTQEKDPLVMAEKSEVMIEITRGPGQLAVDNNPKILRVEEGDRLLVRKASTVARLLSHKS